jgi:hypothetical protein
MYRRGPRRTRSPQWRQLRFDQGKKRKTECIQTTAMRCSMLGALVNQREGVDLKQGNSVTGINWRSIRTIENPLRIPKLPCSDKKILFLRSALSADDRHGPWSPGGWPDMLCRKSQGRPKRSETATERSQGDGRLCAAKILLLFWGRPLLCHDYSPLARRRYGDRWDAARPGRLSMDPVTALVIGSRALRLI